ncbi:pirin family protein [soil metagenome]
MENNDEPTNNSDQDPQLDPDDLPEVGPNYGVLIEARTQDLGSFSVRRVLPFAKAGLNRRHIGSFVFLDHIGPAELDQPMFVSEHPHIGLATATYLFEGEIRHKDSLGSDQVIREGELNLMTAGEWITHIEQGLTNEIHGLQFWIALPLEDEECPPTFRHYDAEETPSWSIAKGVNAHLLMGEYAGKKSNVECRSRILFLVLDSSTSHRIPLELEMNERELGLYVCEGHVTLEEHGSLKAGQLLVFDQPEDGSRHRLQIELGPGARVVLFGGAPLDQPRLMKWNYVASDQELIDQAEAKWAKANKNSIAKPQPPF